jgi:hypothetical protein
VLGALRAALRDCQLLLLLLNPLRFWLPRDHLSLVLLVLRRVSEPVLGVAVQLADAQRDGSNGEC